MGYDDTKGVQPAAIGQPLWLLNKKTSAMGFSFPKQSHIYPIWYPMRSQRCVNNSAKDFYQDLCLSTERLMCDLFIGLSCVQANVGSPRLNCRTLEVLPRLAVLYPHALLLWKSSKKLFFFLMKNQFKLIFWKSVGTHCF